MIRRKINSPKKAKNTKKRNQELISKAKINHLPKKVTQKEFEDFFLPHLSLPKRGFVSNIPLYKIFNYILYTLHTGCQWEKIPIEINPQTGKPEIHYTSVFRRFSNWAKDGSFERLFIATVKRLKDKKKLDTSVINGDGTNNVAKKGGLK